jgi:hypothetical protein
LSPKPYSNIYSRKKYASPQNQSGKSKKNNQEKTGKIGINIVGTNGEFDDAATKVVTSAHNSASKPKKDEKKMKGNEDGTTIYEPINKKSMSPIATRRSSN